MGEMGCTHVDVGACEDCREHDRMLSVMNDLGFDRGVAHLLGAILGIESGILLRALLNFREKGDVEGGRAYLLAAARAKFPDMDWTSALTPSPPATTGGGEGMEKP